MSYTQEMLNKKNWAVVGITNDESKFGFKIPRRLKNHGYHVIGINPKYAGQEIEGIAVYASLKEVPGNVDCIDVLVGPNRSLNVVDEAVENGVEFIWFQPGSFDEAVIQKARDKGLKYVDDACVYALLRHD